jgi:hypothetical protein
MGVLPMLSKRAIEELSKILKEDFRRDVTSQEVLEIGTQLLCFFHNLAEFNLRDLEARMTGGQSGEIVNTGGLLANSFDRPLIVRDNDGGKNKV